MRPTDTVRRRAGCLEQARAAPGQHQAVALEPGRVIAWRQHVLRTKRHRHAVSYQEHKLLQQKNPIKGYTRQRRT